MIRVLPVLAGRVLPVVVGVVLPGCAQLAGIDDTNSRGRTGNSLSVKRLSIGTTVVESPLDLTGLSAMYLVPNPGNADGFDRVLAADVGQGKWNADLPDPAAVQFTLPDLPAPIPRGFAFPNRELSAVFGVLEHPNPSPAPDGAMLTVSATLDVATTGAEAFRVFTVGSWTQHVLAGAEIPALGATQVGPFTYAFAGSQNLSGRPPLSQLTVDDAVFLLRYGGATLTGVAEAAPFNQTGADTVTATMAAVPPSETLEVKVDPARLNQRFAAVRPAVSGLQMSWSVVAAPAYRIASNAGPVLVSGGLLATDVGVTAKYGNPFAARGWNSLFTFASTQQRSYALPGTMATATLSADLVQFIEPSPGFELTLPAGLPQTISIDGTPLTTDGQTIAPPTKFVDVTFIADLPSATLYGVVLVDLVPNDAGTALERIQVFSGASNEAKFQLAPELFKPGHTYTLRAIATTGGYPAIANGDLQTRELPLSQGFLDSAVFTVTP